MMEKVIQKTDIRWLLLVLAAVVLFSIFGLPYFTQTGHTPWAIVVYAFFAVMFLYGRCNHVRKHSSRGQQLR
jgi:RsiW-degrading membrane proteinase PrsW (M82 family)